MGDGSENITLVTMSEFGRTARQNGTGGTDHGHANVMFVLGGHVNGGRVYGRWPGLANEQLNEGRDLAVTTDFRQVSAKPFQKPSAHAISMQFSPTRNCGLTGSSASFIKAFPDRQLSIEDLGAPSIALFANGMESAKKQQPKAGFHSARNASVGFHRRRAPRRNKAGDYRHPPSTTATSVSVPTSPPYTPNSSFPIAVEAQIDAASPTTTPISTSRPASPRMS